MRELQIFFTAVMFYTRIPCPRWVTHEPEFLNLATRYLPFIGWIVGGISVTVLFLCHYLFSFEISVLLSMVAGILLTGAFHEDGFADVCDGFGGGWTKEKILTIMKDSRVGTYGVVGIVFMLLLKLFCLLHLQKFYWYETVLIFVGAHALSRFAPVVMIYTTAYAREDMDSKAKPVAQALSFQNVMIAAGWTIIPLLLFFYQYPYYVFALLPLPLLVFFLRRYFIKWIGGYTGDCLGATQQLTELFFYLGVLAVWKLF